MIATHPSSSIEAPSNLSKTPRWTRYNGPSGHPEPKNVGFPNVSDWDGSDGSSEPELTAAVLKEIFQSAVDEVLRYRWFDDYPLVMTN